MLISLVFDRPDNVLETGDVDFIVENALKVIIVDLFSEISLHFGLVSFAVQCLRYSRLVRLIRQFGFNFDKLGIDLFLKTKLVSLRRWTSAYLPHALQLVGGIVDPFFQVSHLLIYRLELATVASRGRRSSRMSVATTCGIKRHVSLHVIEAHFFLQTKAKFRPIHLVI